MNTHFRSCSFAVLVCSLLAISSRSLASWRNDPPDTVMIQRVSGLDPLKPELITTPPTIDGNLDEPFWKLAPHVSGFKTYAPDFDKIPKEQTEVALAYDKDNLYFAFRCYDDPSKIKASLSARDKMTQDDFVCINLDSFNDQQALTAFYVNPLGIQGDSRFSNNNEDFSPDFVWYSAGKIDSLGYTVEVQLPLKSLRYTQNDPTMMGVILERFISRRSEHSTFPRLDPAKGLALLTQMYPVAYSGIEHYKLLEILPAVTATRQDSRIGNTLVRNKQESDASLTAKYGITSDLIMDGTLNPDFSQVESDAGQVDVNLRHDLYFPEKRPFFLEGLDNFNVASNATPLDPSIYYSRTISDPLVGTKLTGKIGESNTIAAIYALDNVPEYNRDALGRYVNVPILRYKRTLSNDSYMGLMYAARELEHTNNRVVGYDELYRVSDASVVESNGFLSWAKYDPSQPSVAGNTFGTRFSRDTRNLGFSFNFREMSEDFRADMGFITRTGIVNFVEYLNPRVFPDSKLFQRIGFEFTTGQTRDIPSGLWEVSNDAAVNVFFLGNWLFRTRLNHSTEIFNAQRFQTSGVHTQVQAHLTDKVYANLLYRRIRAVYYRTADQGYSNVANVDIVLQPWESLQAEGTYSYSDFYRSIDDEKLVYEGITRLKLTYQVNQYLFFRGIAEYNNLYKELAPEFLTSFTYIPGTAVYLGYGSIFDKVHWDGKAFVPADSFLEMQRGLFMKMSYLWRS